MSVTSERSRCTNVDLPEPEGAEMMNRMPAKVFSYDTVVCLARSPAQVLLKILHLFARFFDLRFHSQAQISNALSIPTYPTRLR
jgi:hypothetical protein